MRGEAPSTVSYGAISPSAPHPPRKQRTAMARLKDMLSESRKELKEPLLVYEEEDGDVDGTAFSLWQSVTIWMRIIAVTATVALLTYAVIGSFDSSGDEGLAIETYNSVEARQTSSAPSPTSTVLQCFQVHAPVLTPEGVSTNDTSSSDVATSADGNGYVVTQTLMVHDFAYSYGQPYVGSYVPPSCSFNRITINFTVEVAGRQYDRLALMYLGDTEVWRTSTAEPTQTGIRWTYIKDMSNYLALFSQPQKLIFDLGNLVDSTYTGIYNTTLTATFFTSPDTVDPADMILPVSARQSAANSPSAFTVPPDNATNSITLPQNLKRAVFTFSACGQAAEEFWWSNVLSSDEETFPSAGALYGYSPFREVQLFIDGQLAGVDWPFPVIFTGGVVPVWRPVVGLEAFDLREHEIDITPFLPLLADGQPHTFTINVAGLNDDGHGHATLSETVGSDWIVTGKVFVWLDTAGSVTTGGSPSFYTPAPSFTISSTVRTVGGVNETLNYSVSASRNLLVTSTVHTSSGISLASWSQSLTYSNIGSYSAAGDVQVVSQSTTGTDIALGFYARTYSYPLWVNSTYFAYPDGSYTLDAVINRGLDVLTLGQPAFPTGLQPLTSVPGAQQGLQGAALGTTMNVTGHYIANATLGTSSASGTEEQTFTFGGVAAGLSPTGGLPAIGAETELYYRQVSAANNTLLSDQERLVGRTIGSYEFAGQPQAEVQQAMGPGVRELLGRGPGEQTQNGGLKPPRKWRR